jgi:hypothetical protein
MRKEENIQTDTLEIAGSSVQECCNDTTCRRTNPMDEAPPRLRVDLLPLFSCRNGKRSSETTSLLLSVLPIEALGRNIILLFAVNNALLHSVGTVRVVGTITVFRSPF